MKIRANAVGVVIANARMDLGLTQVEFAKTLKISNWTLSRLETGHRTFDTKWLELMPPTARAAVKKVLAREVRRS